jgi:hypothetical protein
VSRPWKHTDADGLRTQEAASLGVGEGGNPLASQFKAGEKICHRPALAVQVKVKP